MSGFNGPVDTKSIQIAYHAAFSTYLKVDSGDIEALEALNGGNDVEIIPFYKTYGAGSPEQVLAGHVIKMNDRIVVAFRGTKGWKDVLFRDLKGGGAVWAETGIGDGETKLVQSGFLKDYESSKDNVRIALNAMVLKYPTLPITFTGHSLGGAVAQLAALDYAAKGESYKDKIKAIITYGAPRFIAGGSSVESYDAELGDKTLHVISAGDPIANIPPTLIGFQRTGFVLRIKSAMFSGWDKHSRAAYRDIVYSINSDEQAVKPQKAKQNVTSWWADLRLRSTFEAEFSIKARDYLLNDSFAQGKITQALAGDGDPGQLTRIFDGLTVSEPAKKTAYDRALAAGNAKTIPQHVASVVKAAFGTMLNQDKTDLSQEVIVALGKDNYEQLKALCAKNKTNLVDYLLQAVAASYGQVLTEQLEAQHPEPSERQKFNELVNLPMNYFVSKINKDTIYPSLLSQIKNFLYALVTCNQVETAESLNKQADNVLKCIASIIKILEEAPQDKDYSEIVKEMENIKKRLDEAAEKLCMDSTGEALTDEMKKPLDATDKDKWTKELTTACEAVAKTIQTHFPESIERNKGLLEQILDIIKKYVFNIKEPEAPSPRSTQIKEKLESAGPIMKSVLLLSAAPDTPRAACAVGTSSSPAVSKPVKSNDDDVELTFFHRN